MSFLKSTFCIAEDREECEPSVKLLLLSLSLYCPGAQINLFYPPANQAFLTWMEKCPQVHLRTERLHGSGWNVKPEAMVYLLDRDFEEVIWIDSDVIVNRDIRRLVSLVNGDALVASEHTLSEERVDHNALRARLWGLPVGRVLPFALSSGVVRVTRKHYRLLGRWRELLQTKEYQEAQKKGWMKSPIHMKGDQDVLTALLTSTEFSHIPIRILRRGKHIILFDGVYGYTVPERLRNLLRDGPALVHVSSDKPWSARWQLEASSGLRDYIKKVYLDVSPYTLLAMRFRPMLDCDTGWMEPHYSLSRVLRALGMGYPPLVGLPMAVFADMARAIKSMRRSRLSFCLVSERKSPGDSLERPARNPSPN